MSGDAQPLYFSSGDRTLFGWLHPPLGALTPDLGVVICNPFGYESVCSHRSLIAFAQACAAAGAATLRFDYSDTGDSSDLSPQADQISAWCEDIEAAVELLERDCGVRRVCLLGVRLGALLAGLVASKKPLTSLIAVAPVTSGRRYLRELRAFQAGATADPVNGETEAAPADASTGGGLDITGFRLSGRSVETLGLADLAKSEVSPGIDVLILDRDDLPAAKPWAAALEAKGIAVQYATAPGFTEMVSTPHAAVIPTAMVEAVGQWLDRHHHPAWAAPAAQPDSSPSDPASEAHMRVRDSSGVELIERAMFIDAERTLFAITTELADRASGSNTPDQGIVLLNTGATNHIGPNRMYVELSRRWAAQGYVVLRLDLAGLGDSATRPGEESNQAYPPGALYDIGVAIEFLRRSLGVRNVTLAGLCAGAYHALRSAVSGLPVSTIVLVNPLTFYWKQGSTLSDLQISEVVRNPGVYRRNVLSLQHWRKLLLGRVNLWRILMVFLRRGWLAVDSGLRDLSRKLRIPLPDDLGSDLQSVVARGIRIVFIFARGDAGADLLKLQGGSVVNRLGDHCRIYTLDGADHIFTQRGPRKSLMELMSSELPPL